MRWLPSRAYENGVYVVFTNPIRPDYDTIKPGLSMILDPYGEVLVESHALGEDVVVGRLTPDKVKQASGRRYLKDRRPELYEKLVEPQESVKLPGWRMDHKANTAYSRCSDSSDCFACILKSLQPLSLSSAC